MITSSLLLCSCTKPRSPEPSEAAGVYFDTVVNVEIYGNDKTVTENAADRCMEICDHYQQLFDTNIKTSDIAKINSSPASAIHVDHDTAVMLSETLHYSDISNGKFDITIDPVSKLWDFHEGEYRIPSEAELSEALKNVSCDNIRVDAGEDTVTLLKDNISVDPGGAAKGYIADRIADYLKTQSITGAIINMGGDMYLYGCKDDGSLFNIGINDPDKNGCIMSLYISDCAVATSGTYERCFTKGGIFYHHILDPATGMSAATDIRSVTVISKRSVDSDCLCTVCILLGSKEALDLINSLPDTEAVMILNDASVVMSKDASGYIRQ